MNRSEADKIKSWFLALTLAGFTAEEAIQAIGRALHDERLAASR